MSRKEAVRRLESMGFRHRRQAKHCDLFVHPCGATASIPLTPGEYRSIDNALAAARRAMRMTGSRPS